LYVLSNSFIKRIEESLLRTSPHISDIVASLPFILCKVEEYLWMRNIVKAIT
jgi:hypothetical protein